MKGEEYFVGDLVEVSLEGFLRSIGMHVSPLPSYVGVILEKEIQREEPADLDWDVAYIVSFASGTLVEACGAWVLLIDRPKKGGSNHESQRVDRAA